MAGKQRLQVGEVQAVEIEGRQEGSRWVHKPPAPEDFSAWFLQNVKLHKGMDPTDYVGGIVLIPNSEKVRIPTGVSQQTGLPITVEAYQTVYTPYPKVDIRLRYFWDLCEERGWLGKIESVVPKGALRTFDNVPLPEHFYLMPYPRPADEGGGTGYRMCCTMQVKIFDASQRFRQGGDGVPVMAPPPGTKVGAFSADLNAALRVETGAIGRALGMAGMLVIPGSGVATAEDMQEALGLGGGHAEAQVPVEEPGAGQAQTVAVVDMRERMDRLRTVIESDHPDMANELEAWAQEKDINVNEVNDTQVRAVVKQMERKLASAGVDIEAVVNGGE